MGVPPAAQQQHRLTKPGRRGGVVTPAAGIAWILGQPAVHHPVGVVLSQQLQTIPEVAAVLEGASDRLPCRGLPSPLGLECSQLQSPAQAQMPPVGSAFAAPVPPFIQAGHGRAMQSGGWASAGPSSCVKP